MNSLKKNLIVIFLVATLFFTFKSLTPNQVFACCSDSQCARNQTCVNIPASGCGTQQYGSGVCVNDLETCNSSAQCSSGEECINSLCYAIGTGPSSFMAGTIVSTPEGGKKIEDLKVGDRVISFTENTIVESIVSKTHKVRRDYYFDLVADGYRVKVTAKHPFYIGNDEFKTAEELKAGDNVYVLEKKSLVKKRVTSKTRVEKKADVYNLTVDGTNTYFAGGFAVHNKGPSECNTRKVNCPTGYRKTNTVQNTECKADYGGTAAWCSGVGTAQAVTGCCDNWKRCEDEPDPEKKDCCAHGNDQITTYACVPICNTTVPTITEIEEISSSKAKINWTRGTGGTSQKIFIGANKTLVEANCVGAMSPACVVKKENLTAAQTSYATGNVLSAGTIYYVKVVNSSGANCNSSSQTSKFLSSCSLSPSSTTRNINQTQDLISNLSSSTEITKVKYISNNAGVASVSPANDVAYVYKTTATAKSVGNTTVTSDVYFGSVITCTANATITVISPAAPSPSPPPPSSSWWQVKDGSVHSGSDIFSDIPGACAGGCTPSLLTGVSGLASYLGTLGVGGGSLSQDGTNWQAETVYTGTRTGFGYFKRLLEDNPAGIGVWDGGLPAQDGVSLAESGVTTDGTWNIGAGEKLVFLADGEVTIAGNIDVAPGGFLAVIASGNINIHPSVTKVEGVFISDGTIGTGISNQQLTGEGIFTGWEGVNLQRNLDDDSQTPAELFVYRPDLQLNAYRYLLWLGINWREVAP